MKSTNIRSTLVLMIFAIFGGTACGSTSVRADTWEPSSGHTQIPIWKNEIPDALPAPGPETVSVGDGYIGGNHVTGIDNVSIPTMTLYQPKDKNTGVAVVVIPGGGFVGLAMDLEGTEVCDWLTSKGINCVLLKYRVPSLPYDWHCKCRPNNLMVSTQALEDVQRTMGLVRLHAKEWSIDPHKIGVLGFSAGGYLVAEISTIYKKRLYAPTDEADNESCRPDFALPIYPGHLVFNKKTYELNHNIPVTSETPPTFLLQAEDDDVDDVSNSLIYFSALRNSGVPVEMHIFAHGKHAFGLRPTELPITHWPDLAETWLRTIGMTSK